MKNYICSTICLCLCFLMFAQETKHDNLLNADNSWSKEIFTFPIGFAQEIPLEGYEEAIFPKGWSKIESDEFWSYIFAWNVKVSNPLTTTKFEDYLELYFDGLMNIHTIKKGDSIVPANALFETSAITGSSIEYTGKIRLYEGRYTNKMMYLYVLASQHFCEKQQKSVVVFRFSPKQFEHTIWETLSSVKLRDNYCSLE